MSTKPKPAKSEAITVTKGRPNLFITENMDALVPKTGTVTLDEHKKRIEEKQYTMGDLLWALERTGSILNKPVPLEREKSLGEQMMEELHHRISIGVIDVDKIGQVVEEQESEVCNTKRSLVESLLLPIKALKVKVIKLLKKVKNAN